MRTTLTLDDDVLAAARGLAVRQSRSLGEVISDLSRQSLMASVSAAPATRNGIPLLPRRAGAPLVTMELVNRLRDETG